MTVAHTAGLAASEISRSFPLTSHCGTPKMRTMKKEIDVLDAPETTPERLVRYRRREGLTQEELGARCRLGAGIIRDAEREEVDRRLPLTLKSIRKIEAATGVVGWLGYD